MQYLCFLVAMVSAETVAFVEGGRRQGRQKKRWEDRIGEWTGLEFTSPSPRRRGEQRKMEETDLEVICGAKTTLAIKRSVKVKG